MNKVVILKDLNLSLNAVHDRLYDISDFNLYKSIVLQSIQFDSKHVFASKPYTTKISLEESFLCELGPKPHDESADSDKPYTIADYQAQLVSALKQTGVEFTELHDSWFCNKTKVVLHVSKKEWPEEASTGKFIEWIELIVGSGVYIVDIGGNDLSITLPVNHVWPKPSVHPWDANADVRVRLGFSVKPSKDASASKTMIRNSSAGFDKDVEARKQSKYQVALTKSFLLPRDNSSVVLDMPIYEPWQEPICLDAVRIRLESTKTNQVYYQSDEQCPTRWSLVFMAELHEDTDDVFTPV